MRISLVSLNQIWEDKEKNLTLIEEHFKFSSQQNVDLIIFPEMTFTGFSMNVKKILENKSGFIPLDEISKLSKKYGIGTIFGDVVKSNDEVFNASYFISKTGNEIGKYFKIHLFSYAKENKFFKSGRSLCQTSFMNFKIGLSICYDLRFPELYSSLSKDSDIIVNIANWPKERINHWKTLLKARAIENQVFIIGVNRTGTDGNSIQYTKSSYIVDPDGNFIKPVLSNKSSKVFEIHRNDLISFRKKFSPKKDRLPMFYKEIL